MPETPIPARLLQRRAVYRQNRRGVAVVGGGFLPKAGPRDGFSRVSLDYVAMYVLRGSGVYTDHHGRQHRLTAGCVAQVAPGRRDALTPDDDGRWVEFYLVLTRAFYVALRQSGAATDQPVLRPGIDAVSLELCDSIFDQLIAAPQRVQPSTGLKAHQLLLHWLDAHRRRFEPGPHARMIDQATRLLADDPQQRLRLSELARRFNLSYERFRKVFREHVGVSPGEFRIRRRIDRARELLVQEKLSPTEVAYELGYPDPFAFSKQFKRYVGVPPSHFAG